MTTTTSLCTTCSTRTADYGDLCERCHDQDQSYVIVTALDETWITSEQAEAMESILAGQGWDVEIRRPRQGEAEGTYRHTDHGLQILGYSVSEPADLRVAIERAADQTCHTATQSE